MKKKPHESHTSVWVFIDELQEVPNSGLFATQNYMDVHQTRSNLLWRDILGDIKK